MSLTTVVRRGYGSNTPDAVVRRGYAASSALPQPPVAGKQYVSLTSLSWLGDSLQQGLSPPPTLGCVFVVDTQVDGYSIQVNGDGTFIVYAAFDTTPQTFQADLINPVTAFDWGAWNVTCNPAVIIPTPPPPIGITPAVPASAAFAFADPAITAQIDGQIRALYPNGWFPT